MKLIEELEGFFSSRIAIIKDFYVLAKLEASLAGQSIYPLILYLSVLMPLICAIWLTLMLTLGVVLFPFLESMVLILLIVLSLNVCFLIVIIQKIKKLLKEISFSRTRSCLTSMPLKDNHDIQKRASNSD
ncbi:hypothetical protein [Legionella fairfieldensis]|uniref:hypothetical protein n=1 Tax=Legionella fairfieldensis TaxID=45064 RepID=UPI00048EBEB3|nr:hypothetical protein [Legionella fairfieldensis]